MSLFQINRNWMKLFSSEYLIFLIGDDSAIFLHLKKGDVLCRLFLSNVYDFNASDLFEYMHRHAKIPLYIFLSNIDQKYVIKTVPQIGLFGFDLFLKMRLKKDFSSFDIREFHNISELKSTQNKHEYMFVLGKTSSYIDEWLTVITKYSENFKGMSMFPPALNTVLQEYTSVELPSSKDTNYEWVVFVVCTKVSGFTHIVLKNGVMLFSRLVQMMNDISPNILVGSIYQDIENTLNLVTKFGFSRQKDKVRLFCVLPSDLKTTFIGVANEKMEVSVIDMRKFAEKNEITGVCLDDRFADTVLCTAITRHLSHLCVFRTEKVREFYWLCFFNNYIPLSAAIISLLLILLNVFISTATFLQKDEIKKYDAELSFLHVQVDQSDSGYNLDRLNRTNELINMYKALKALDHHPLKYVKILNGIYTYGFMMSEFYWTVSKPNNKLQIYLGYTAPATGIFFANYQMLSKEIAKAFPNFEIVPSKIPESLTTDRKPVHVSFLLK